MVAEFEKLIAWYDAGARDLPWRKTCDPYAIWVSEVMLQQTRVEAVKGYYTRFLTDLPTIKSLAAVDEPHLLKLWEGLGYYSRARNLKKAAISIMEHHDGHMPASYEELLSLPGIGEYTAGAIASIAFSIPVPAVDGNVLRVFARLNNDQRNILDLHVKAELRDALLHTMPVDRPGTFNQAVMELGAMVCLPNGTPLCKECPLNKVCKAHSAGTELELPVREKKNTRRKEEKTVFVIHTPLGIPVFRRQDTGLLAGLWQLPELPGTLDNEAIAAQLTAWGAQPSGEWSTYHRKHVFTHVEWHMHVISISAEAFPLPSGWEYRSESRHPLPTAYKCCLE